MRPSSSSDCTAPATSMPFGASTTGSRPSTTRAWATTWSTHRRAQWPRSREGCSSPRPQSSTPARARAFWERSSRGRVSGGSTLSTCRAGCWTTPFVRASTVTCSRNSRRGPRLQTGSYDAVVSAGVLTAGHAPATSLDELVRVDTARRARHLHAQVRQGSPRVRRQDRGAGAGRAVDARRQGRRVPGAAERRAGRPRPCLGVPRAGSRAGLGRRRVGCSGGRRCERRLEARRVGEELPRVLGLRVVEHARRRCRARRSARRSSPRPPARSCGSARGCA